MTVEMLTTQEVIEGVKKVVIIKNFGLIVHLLHMKKNLKILLVRNY